MRIGIIGTGLIGASIGLACRERGDEVLGCDIDAGAFAAAIRSHAVDRAASRDELYECCDVVVIAAHLRATLAEMAELREHPLRRNQLVIDVASVKAPIAAAAHHIPAFIPTHPMAGSEQRGASAARADLFSGRSWCYVPTTDEARTQAARDFIERFGARPVAVDAHDHDRIVALTSHLPQLIAYAFTRCVAELAAIDPETTDALCGRITHELLRLGRSSPQMWDEIFAANASEIDSARIQVEAALNARWLSR